MQTPSPKYFCPRCRAAFERDTNYCGRCGADMRHASRLEYARTVSERSSRHSRPVTGSGRETDALHAIPEDRRGSEDHWLGRVVDGRYRVIDIVGRGGMGVVYKVEHQRMGKIAAMKVLHKDLAEDRETVSRFRVEANAVSRLTHPNTVQVFDFGASRGALYLVMELVRGLDLGSLVDRDGPMPLVRAAPLFAQICAALEEAHELGVIHRDLKPENVLVTRTHGGHDFVKVLDFGLAKLGEREEASKVTSDGAIVGTPYYMSPEQIRGESTVGAASDIYSLGALMYRVLTDEPAFTAQSPVGVLTKHLTERPEPPSKRSPGLRLEAVDELILRCLQKKPDDRFRRVSDVVAALTDAYAEVASEQSSPDLLRLPSGQLRASSRGGSLHPAPVAIDYGADDSLHLQRSDLEGFERGLKRRRAARIVLLPLLLLGGVAGAVYWFALRPQETHRLEVEPNDQIDSATLVAPGIAVKGFLGKRIDRATPDKDFYRVPQLDAPQVVTASVSGVPNIDHRVSLYDHNGSLIASADEGGVGADEHLRRVRVTSAPLVVVTEVMAPSQDLPVENVSDAYELKITISATDPRLEEEPNNSESDATRLNAGNPVSGHLDRRGDIDVYRFDGRPGRHRILISGGPSQPFSWRIDRGPWRRELSVEEELTTGAIITLRRDDGTATIKVGDAGNAYTIDVSPVTSE